MGMGGRLWVGSPRVDGDRGRTIRYADCLDPPYKAAPHATIPIPASPFFVSSLSSKCSGMLLRSALAASLLNVVLSCSHFLGCPVAPLDLLHSFNILGIQQAFI